MDDKVSNGVEFPKEAAIEKETYAALKARHQAEIDAFPFGFAFNDKQFSEMMAKWGLATDATDKIYNIGGGGYIRKSDATAMEELFSRHKAELITALCDEQFALEAVSHQECLPNELTAYLAALDLTVDDINTNPKLKHILQKAIEEKEKHSQTELQ